jgi:sphinganine-1-phosphate aldolase
VYHDTDNPAICSFRNIIFFLFLLRWTRRAFYQLRGRGIAGSIVDGYIAVRHALYGIFLRLPGVRTKVQTQIAESILKLERKLVPTGPGVERTVSLPAEGWSEERVRTALQTMEDMEHTRWEDGRVSGAVYHGGAELLRLQTEAFAKFTVANPIHPDVFPGVRKMEAEVVAMVSCISESWEKAIGHMLIGPGIVTFQCPRGCGGCHDEWRNRVNFDGLLERKAEGIS